MSSADRVERGDGCPDTGSVVITPYDDGPLLVRGEFTLTTQDGETIPTGCRTVALCRCGRSAAKPFCDGTHKAARFRARGRSEE